ncbi:LptF/LptG family permease [soil metagenome]
MKILTRYLLRAHLGPFLFAFGALTGVLLVNTLAKEMAKLAGKGLPLEVIGRFFVLFLPAQVALTLPMAVLVAVLYTFSRLASENEITAIKASGIDLKRLLIPLFAAAAIITLGMLYFNDRVLSTSNYQLRQLMVDIGRKSPTFVLRAGVINTIPSQQGQPRYYLRANRIDMTANRLFDVVIYDRSDPRAARTIYADSGTVRLGADGTDLFLRLYDGQIREGDFDNPPAFQRLAYRDYAMRIPGVANNLQLEGGSGYRGDREMSIGMLSAAADTLRVDLARVRREAAAAARSDLAAALGERPPDSAAAFPSAAASSTDLTLAGLRSAGARSTSIQAQIREYQVEIHKKFSIAFATLVFVLLGAPLAIRFSRGGLGMTIFVSLSVFALYYVGLIGGETLADKGFVSPAVAMWIMNALMTAVGLIGVTRLGREKGTPRGGGFPELLPAWLSRLRGIRSVRPKTA